MSSPIYKPLALKCGGYYIRIIYLKVKILSREENLYRASFNKAP